MTRHLESSYTLVCDKRHTESHTSVTRDIRVLRETFRLSVVTYEFVSRFTYECVRDKRSSWQETCNDIPSVCRHIRVRGMSHDSHDTDCITQWQTYGMSRMWNIRDINVITCLLSRTHDTECIMFHIRDIPYVCRHIRVKHVSCHELMIRNVSCFTYETFRMSVVTYECDERHTSVTGDIPSVCRHIRVCIMFHIRVCSWQEEFVTRDL